MKKDIVYVKEVEDPKLVVHFPPDLVHRIAGKVDVSLSQISSRSRYILLVLSSIKSRPKRRRRKGKEERMQRKENEGKGDKEREREKERMKM